MSTCLRIHERLQGHVLTYLKSLLKLTSEIHSRQTRYANFNIVRPRGGWQRGLEPSLHDRPSKEIGRVGLCTNFIPNKHGGGEEGE